MGFFEGLTLALVILKLMGIITISWLLCFAPIFAALGLFVLAAIFAGLAALLNR